MSPTDAVIKDFLADFKVSTAEEITIIPEVLAVPLNDPIAEKRRVDKIKQVRLQGVAATAENTLQKFINSAMMPSSTRGTLAAENEETLKAGQTNISVLDEIAEQQINQPQGLPRLKSGQYHLSPDGLMLVTPDNQVLINKGGLEGRGQGSGANWFIDRDGNEFLAKFDALEVAAQETTMSNTLLPEDKQHLINESFLGHYQDKQGKYQYFSIQKKAKPSAANPSGRVSPKEVTAVEDEQFAEQEYSLEQLAKHISGSDRHPGDLRHRTSFELSEQESIQRALDQLSDEQLNDLASIYFARIALRDESVHCGQIMVMKDSSGHVLDFCGIDFGARNRNGLKRMQDNDISALQTSKAYIEKKGDPIRKRVTSQRGRDYLGLMLKNERLKEKYIEKWQQADPSKMVNSEVKKLNQILQSLPNDHEKDRFMSKYIDTINKAARPKYRLQGETTNDRIRNCLEWVDLYATDCVERMKNEVLALELDNQPKSTEDVKSSQESSTKMLQSLTRSESLSADRPSSITSRETSVSLESSRSSNSSTSSRKSRGSLQRDSPPTLVGGGAASIGYFAAKEKSDKNSRDDIRTTTSSKEAIESESPNPRKV